MMNVFLSRKEHDLILSQDSSLLVRAFAEARATSWCIAGVELYNLPDETAEQIRDITITLEN